MLNKIIGSEARVKILNAFLIEPDKQHYLRQLARDLDLQVNSVRRELNNLEELGLIEVADKETSAKEKKYYAVNANFLLFNELRALFLKAQLSGISKFIADVQKICTPQLFILSGFFVNSPENITDLLIVGDLKKDLFLKRLRSFEQELGREINYTLMTEAEYSYRLELGDIFLNNILSSKKTVFCDHLTKATK
ncbi:ArsR family transcriptional regulator [Candidatus Falkowbacteria bacterium]|jgi:DNA-binding transcriptional regulator YhcF (GntR family)|nr:winged helix-turn-helix domain-containing protein [Patescibacteria group bacterium]MDD3435244.1 winged helix-turn-helix domain-containing protein [Patescibacteria group bacterium]MDD4466786.1 winged helix-turn-helix domain-containing protein [Patescibacteria group bacterium]NCU42862.1 ArsR family transcriptional regulator [Candidatus Falkowbacteria bacterium]